MTKNVYGCLDTAWWVNLPNSPMHDIAMNSTRCMMGEKRKGNSWLQKKGRNIFVCVVRYHLYVATLTKLA